jgi:galactokinase
MLASGVAEQSAMGFIPVAGAFTAAGLSARLEHFLLESLELVGAAGDALVAGDLAALGRVVERSQAGAERLLGNQVRETIWLARRARELGAVAASAFGAGFGGSVWALVRQDIVPELLERWRDDYLETFPRRSAARFFGTIAGPPASVTPALPLETVP